MMPFLIRTGKRAAVLAVGLGVVYIAIWRVFPYFDNRLPAALAVFLTYIVMAYIILPAILRSFRFFVRPSHIPLYCVTPDGFACDPLNIGIIGTRKQIIKAMTAAGWFLADERTPHTVFRQLTSILTRQYYPNAPFSTLYLLGRRQDFGFELPVKGKVSHRHHVRFWGCSVEAPEEFQGHISFWRRFHRPAKAQPNRQLWVGAASKDIGFAPIRHNAQLTHRVHPNTNAERQLIVHDLEATGLVKKKRTVTIGSPYRLRNRALRSFLRSDGKLTICELRTR